MCSAQKSLGVHAIKDRGKLEEHAAQQAWTGKKERFQAMSFAKVHSRIVFVKKQQGHCLLLLPLHRLSRLFFSTCSKNINQSTAY